MDGFQMPPKDTVDGLVRLGLAILDGASLGPVSDFGTNSTITTMKMPDLLDFLLQNKTQAVELVAPLIGPNTTDQQVVDAMTSLKYLIPHLDHGVQSPAFYLAALTVPTVCIALRLYVRKFVTRKVRADDWFALATLLILYMCMAAFCFVNKFSAHVWDMSFREYQRWWITVWLNGPFFNVAHFFVKITFLLFYYSLSPARWYRYSLIAIGVFVTCYSIVGILTMMFQCKPINFWDHLWTAKCFSMKDELFALGIIYIVTDFLILFIPVSIVWKLQLRNREKFIVLSIFGMMAFICVVSINRLIAIMHWLNAADITYAAVSHGCWAAAELDLALSISCLPAIKALFPRLKFGRFTTNNSDPNSTPVVETVESDSAESGRRLGREKKPRGAIGRGVAGLTTLGTVDGGEAHEEAGEYTMASRGVSSDTSIAKSESNKSVTHIAIGEADEIELDARSSKTRKVYEMV